VQEDCERCIVGNVSEWFGADLAESECLRVTNPGAIIITHGHRSGRPINETTQKDKLYQ
jgi:hypothetical protein